MDVVNVLFIWKVRDELKVFFQTKLNDFPVKLIFPETGEYDDYKQFVNSTEIIIGWRPPQSLLDNAFKLKLFINPGAGVQHLIDDFREKDIILCNGHSNSYFTAQHTVALLMALMNKVIPHHNWMVEGKWRRGDEFAKSIPLRNKNVGLLGYGAVNQKVHKFLSGFDITFSALKTHWTDKTPGIAQYTVDELHKFLTDIDILIIAIPLTNKTKHLISEYELSLLKNKIVVNMARGEVINERDFYNALKHNILLGAAIDVWYNYQPKEINGHKFPSEYPFYKLENVVLSPHRGASPFDDIERWEEVTDNIRRYIMKEPLLNVVNIEREY